MKKEIRIVYDSLHLSELSSDEQNLVKEPRMSCENAYAPYSKFKVGASALLANGKVVSGSNQENIVYPSGLCAERVALFSAGAQFPGVEIHTLVIVAKGDLLKEGAILSPCGGCRQVMSETEMRQNKFLKVILVDTKDQATIFESASDFLPITFGK